MQARVGLGRLGQKAEIQPKLMHRLRDLGVKGRHPRLTTFCSSVGTLEVYIGIQPDMPSFSR